MKGLKYVSLWDAQGYAESAARNLTALAQQGVPLSWHPMHFYGVGHGMAPCRADEVAQHPLQPLFQRPIDYDTVLFHVIPHPGLTYWLEGEAGKHLVLNTAWETDRLPAGWPALLNRFDRVLVASKWNRQVCQASGVRVPLWVVPHLLPHMDPQEPPAAPNLPVPADRFVFYTIGEWTRRKTLDDVLTAYWQAFTAADPVLLVIKTTRLNLAWATYRRFVGRLWRWAGTTDLTLLSLKARQQLRRPGRLPPVGLVSQNLPARAMAALHARGDCYITLAHGEGWGLGAYEAASLGKPVITTGWGGQLDFLPAEAAYHVPYRLVPARGGAYEALFTPEQHWAQADLGPAAALMRQVAGDPGAARARGRALQALIARDFNEPAIMSRLLQALAGA